MITAVVFSALAVVALLAWFRRKSRRRNTVDEVWLVKTLQTWPDAPRLLAKEMFEQYGPPNEGSDSMLVWTGRGPFETTIIYRDHKPDYSSSRSRE